MKLLLTLLAGLIGAGLGGFLGVVGGAALAPAFGISDFEGAAGYFAVFIGGPIGAIVGLAAGIVLAARLSGMRSGAAIAGRFGLAVVVLIALIAGGIAFMYWNRDLVTTDGPPPKLAFEIRLPAGTATPMPADVTVHLDSIKSHMPATILGAQFRRDGDRPIIVGSVDIIYRESNRLLVLRLPNQPDQIFALKLLGREPKHARELSPWQRVDFVAEQGQTAPRRATAADTYEVRYRAVWAGQE
ncbi:MAG TPA: hypothetical protein VNK48_01615 [Xanthobacteraceae bacterium]|nr:hypothetical protein [Xanthobacteraceae bacterium]